MSAASPSSRRVKTRAARVWVYVSVLVFALLEFSGPAGAVAPPVPPGLRKKSDAAKPDEQQSDSEDKTPKEAAPPLPPGLARQREAEAEARANADAQADAQARIDAEAQAEPPAAAAEVAPSERRGGEASSAIYFRSDTDSTQIISPQVHFRKTLGTPNTNLDVVYIADIWTSASVDIRTAASVEVREQRDEIDLGIDHTKGTTVVGAGYRYSHEVDYVSHALSLSLAHEAFQRNTNFSARAFVSKDEVGRSGDTVFARDVVSTGAWLGLSQVLGKHSLAQLSLEARLMQGYLASPYRYVPLGAFRNCAAESSTCVPEVHPNQKLRLAAVARVRRALGERASFGLAYRYYFDNWKLDSHTGIADIAFRFARDTVVVFGYRGYLQSAAFFYQPRYAEVDNLDNGAYLTRDRELSRLHNHQGSVRIEHRIPLLVRAADLVLGFMFGQTYYVYKEFPGLDRVRADEISANAGVEF